MLTSTAILTYPSFRSKTLGVLLAFVLVPFSTFAVQGQESIDQLALEDYTHGEIQDSLILWASQLQDRREENTAVDALGRAQKEAALQREEKRLRNIAYDYLDIYGLPEKAGTATWMDSIYQATFQRIKVIPESDSLRRKEILLQGYTQIVARTKSSTLQQRILNILNTEPDFSERCKMISFLRSEYENGNINVLQFTTYLEYSYQIMHGGERFDLPPGTKGDERLNAYSNELSGC